MVSVSISSPIISQCWAEAKEPDRPQHCPIPLDLTICGRCAPEKIVTISNLMETYRIIPLGHAYRVEAVEPNGQTRVVRTWPTEEAAVSHLKALREVAERLGHALQPGEKDWRG